MCIDEAARREARDAGIFWMTRCIAQGGRPRSPAVWELLRRQGVTHVLDLTEGRSRAAHAGPPYLLHESVEDYTRIPEGRLLACLSAMHGVLCRPGTRLFLHCFAGHGRSPTLLWLYLSACGMEPDAAEYLIRSVNTGARPGEEGLTDAAHPPLARQYGRDTFLPLVRPEILETFA
jgi:hypothetical protein